MTSIRHPEIGGGLGHLLRSTRCAILRTEEGKVVGYWGVFDDTGRTRTRIVWRCPFGLTHSFAITRNRVHFLRHFLVSRQHFLLANTRFSHSRLGSTTHSCVLTSASDETASVHRCRIMSGFHSRPLGRMGYPATGTLVSVGFSMGTHVASLTRALSVLEVINFRPTFPSSS